jgi:hydrogenase maturation protein HypF
MAGFVICPACQAEYRDPLNRRFHAQPNACWRCGPQLQLWDAGGAAIAAEHPVAVAAELLRAGKVVAIKGLGGFHLAVDAANAAAVAGLRERKRRVEKPFAVMVSGAEAAARLCEMDDAALAALQSRQRPIVLLRKKPDADVAPGVAPFNRHLGVFLPYTPLHHLLLAGGGFEALVMTSGNRSEEPIAIANQEAVERLRGLADFFLVHNRDILLRCDDSVVRLQRGTAVQVRRSRGYVPAPVFLAHDLPEVLAVGGEMKNTICLTKGRHAFLSQHIGDLENLESYRFFEEAVEHLSRVLEIAPRAIACDLHPDYFSTRWALGREGGRPVPVQHHHAHIAACMAENHLDGRVIGIALDGTGYGTDGNIWGGEVLLADYAGFERAAHLDYVPMPGGDAAVREPWRMAVAYLAHHFGRRFLDLDIPLLGSLDRRAVEVVLRMLERRIHAPLTSSCGRLFDAVAALAGVRTVVNYEAQAAIELENLVDESAACPPYEFSLITGRAPWLIDTRPMFDALVEDVRNQVPAGVISRRFHDGLGELFARVALLLRERTGLDRVCLSGGTFNNAYLGGYLGGVLLRQGLQVFTHQHVPTGDGGLILGQAMVAAHRLKVP